MQILIVGLKTNPQFKRLQEEAEKRGHAVEGCFVTELVIKTDTNYFDVSLRGKPIDHDLIYLWAVGKRRWEWYTAAHFLNKTKETLIVNSKSIASDYLYFETSVIDYLRQYDETLPFPKTAIIFSSKSLDFVKKDFDFPLIVKKSEGRQGKGVFLAQNEVELRKIVHDLLLESPSVNLREFIPNDGDIRIFTVGYKAIGAMKRTATREGEFRSNISQGGRGEVFDLSSNSEIKEIAEKLSAVTRTEIAGVDIIIHKKTGKPYILEINPGPQFAGFEKYTGVNAAGEIIKFFESLYNK